MNNRTSDRTFAAAVVTITCLWSATHNALATDPPPHFADDAAQHERFGEEAGGREAGHHVINIRTTVQRANGAPVEGAVVITSAGGQGVTDAHGVAVFEVAIPAEADELHLTAIEPTGATGAYLIGNNRVRGLRGRDGHDENVDGGLIVLRAGGECEPQWLPTFGGQPSVGSTARALALHDDGTGLALYIGGHFTSAGGISADYIVRWDGTLGGWSPVGGGMNDWVNALVVFDDGSGPALFAGGYFTVAGGQEAKRIAKWDGTSWEPLGSGIDGGPGSVYVDAMAVFDDGTGSGPALFVGGNYSTAGGHWSPGIAKWDGQTWTPMVGLGGTVSVKSFAEFDSGAGPSLHLGGWFNPPGPVKHIARMIVNPSSYGWAGLAGGMNTHVYALAVFDDGSGSGPALYAGGNFTLAGGVPANRVAKWDGMSWSPLGDGMTSIVYALTVFDDGSGSGPLLYAGGNFAPTKWDGTSWSPIGGGQAHALLGVDEGIVDRPTLFAAGGGGWVAGWSPSTNWQRLDTGLNKGVHALTVHADRLGGGPALFASGEFSLAGNQPLTRVSKWDDAEGKWTSVGDLTVHVTTLKSFDGELYAGSLVGEGVITYDADQDEWVSLGPALGPWQGSGRVNAIEVFVDQDGAAALYAGGRFSTMDSVEASAIAMWNGSTWTDVGGGLHGSYGAHGTVAEVAAMAVFDDGSGSALYVAGIFITAGDVPVNNLAKWDGASWSDVGGGIDPVFGSQSPVRAFAVYDDGSGKGPVLVVGGLFTSIGDLEANCIATWNGTEWLPLGTGASSRVDTLAVVEDEAGWQTLYVGGTFSVAGGVAANRVAMWDGTSWSPLAAGVSHGAVHALTVRYNDSDDAPMLYVGGSFRVSPGADSFITRWRHCPPPTCVAPDLNCDGSVGVADLLILMSMWGPCADCGDCLADLNGDCTVDADDLFILLANWG